MTRRPSCRVVAKSWRVTVVEPAGWARVWCASCTRPVRVREASVIQSRGVRCGATQLGAREDRRVLVRALDLGECFAWCGKLCGGRDAGGGEDADAPAAVPREQLSLPGVHK